MISTVIFDMNGVITDDEDCHELATQKAFGEAGLQMSPEMYRTYCLGRTDASAFKELMAAYAIENTEIGELIARKKAYYLELVQDNLKIFDGVMDLIERLNRSYTLALTTSSTFEEASVVIDLLQLQEVFKVRVTSEDVIKGKPDPEPYLLTAKKLGVRAHECMVIEDSENGVKSAKAAGMACVAITNSEKPGQLMLADRIVSSYTKITDGLIASLSP
ncbi:HAD family hydrolase [Pseudozobellia thermophila]|uniref:Haloacid dehalogenase superfamily, subfamily IA, variant 3 with third motif having DD or ED/haloacid dehalogenase superfamily, subfamily IA, variant 1 with third motif having Dx(3-4)D or Dx(3-4)E n=1 Tax=Pseudozobellia thermophila TaxID=192903 RepID=A0A1M6I523_9FLAO|nr:HAD family phosphatase [Pseudozobellia thermophila]SHJ29484.1 haloacid dehalogenase superfamily, subfamily IA, variant 3 with third motif having DD or ED/haloacid dehalogenase superfamily, subfamily IA, variant 1 with third motif having Dx(3-4)D or Dx(3-4)E [Pseudozobellia thermophila]